MRQGTVLLLTLVLLIGCNEGGATSISNAIDQPTTTPQMTTTEPAVEPSSTSQPTSTGAANVTPTARIDPPPNLAGRVEGWETDWSQHTVPLEELFSGGPPRDGIPPIDDPRFISIEEAAADVAADEPVLVFEHDGEARAYPLAVLIWHEIVNDEVNGQPVTITYCPLCNTALAFDRSLDGQLLDFGTSGLLRNSDLVMWDRQTESLWQQVTGEAIVGELAGQHLTLLAASILSFNEFRDSYPEGTVLSRETASNRAYGSNPYEFYDNLEGKPFLFTGEPDDRLPEMERVVGVVVNDVAVAYPFSVLAEQVVINDEVGGEPVAVFYAPNTLSALDASEITEARAVGSAVAYDPVVDGQPLQFESRDGAIFDTQTSTQWDMTGYATDGPLAGRRLTVLPHANHFWFAFAAFFPQAKVWGQ